MSDLQVTTVQGVVEGRSKNDVLMFSGLPYAAPPIGPMRFRPPAPPESWEGVRDATRFGAAALQTSGDPGSLLGSGPKHMDEDCLTLNVVTPAADGAARPVLVWIHGGGFRTGTGAIPWYDGSSFALRGDIVTVTINYRLGVFGFAEFGGVDPELRGSANNGIRDQIAALEWVRDNIAAFGGDPSQVTIAGESAGGMSVGTLLGCPSAAGLFRSAIPQSGAGDNCLTIDDATAIGAEVAEAVGATSAADLAAATTDDLLAAQTSVSAASVKAGGLRLAGGGVSLGMTYQPVVDGDFLALTPREAVQSGQSADVALMIGTNKDEFTLFTVGPTDDARLAGNLDSLTGDAAAAESVYRSRVGDDASNTVVLDAAMTDATFRIPAIRLAEAHQGSTFMYLFAWESRVPGLGATHALEIPFAFNVLDRPGVAPFIGEGPEPTAVADAMHDAWIDFIRNGVPGWPTYDTTDRTTMVFNNESKTEQDPLADERQLWG